MKDIHAISFYHYIQDKHSHLSHTFGCHKTIGKFEVKQIHSGIVFK